MSTVSSDPGVRSLKRAQVRFITVFAAMNTIGVRLIALGSTLFSILILALFCGPVLYYVFRVIYGGPGNPSSETGNEALAPAEAEAAEDAP